MSTKSSKSSKSSNAKRRKKRAVALPSLDKQAMQTTVDELETNNDEPYVYVQAEKGIKAIETWTAKIPFSKVFVNSLRNKVYWLKFWKIFRSVSTLFVRGVYCFDVLPDAFCEAFVSLLATMMWWVWDTVCKVTNNALQFGKLLSLIALQRMLFSQHTVYLTYFLQLFTVVKHDTNVKEKIQLVSKLHEEIPKLLQAATSFGVRLANLAVASVIGTRFATVQQKSQAELLQLGDGLGDGTSTPILDVLTNKSLPVIAQLLHQNVTPSANRSVWNFLFADQPPGHFDADQHPVQWNQLPTVFQQIVNESLSTEQGLQMTSDVTAFALNTTTSQISISKEIATTALSQSTRLVDTPLVAVHQMVEWFQQHTPQLAQPLQKYAGLVEGTEGLQHNLSQTVEGFVKELDDIQNYTKLKAAKDLRHTLLPGWLPNIEGAFGLLSTRKVKVPLVDLEDPQKEILKSRGQSVLPSITVGLVGIEVTLLMLCGFVVLLLVLCKLTNISFRPRQVRKM